MNYSFDELYREYLSYGYTRQRAFDGAMETVHYYENGKLPHNAYVIESIEQHEGGLLVIHNDPTGAEYA